MSPKLGRGWRRHGLITSRQLPRIHERLLCSNGCPRRRPGADLVINGNATQANMPSAMSASNPMTVVVDGNFSMTIEAEKSAHQSCPCDGKGGAEPLAPLPPP